ncbi:MAG: tetratricopeptide repeat protein, partial [Chloroflexia bacterium]
MCSSDDEALGPVRELARRGRKDQALAMLQSLLRENPDSVPALLWYAALTPDLEKGIRALERVLGLDPDNARARAGLNDLRARLSCQRDGGGGTSCYAPPAEGEPDTSRGEARHETPPVSMPSLVSGDEIVQLAGRVIWPFRGLNRPIQELLENGQIREQDLAWAGRKAYDPCVKWAAGVLLRREHLKGRQFSPEQMGALPWPYKELNRPLGELLCQGLVSLHDLAYALTQGREMLICAAAVLGYPIVQQLAGGAAPSLPIQAKPTLPTPEGAPPSPPREPESVKPARAPRRGPSPASDKVSPASPAPVREPLEIVSGSGYLGKELQAAREKRRKTVKWASCLVIAIASVAPIIVILLRLLGLPAQYALGISLAAIIGILFLLDRLTIPFLRRLKGEEEDFLAGKEG